MEVTKADINKWKAQYVVLVRVSVEDTDGDAQDTGGTVYEVIMREPTTEELISAMDGINIGAQTQQVSAKASMENMLELYNSCVLYEPEAIGRSGLLQIQAANAFIDYCERPKKKKVSRI